jgi:hypothetical protein
VAHYNIDEQGATLTNQFKVPPGQHEAAAKLQTNIYGMVPEGKTTHSIDKAGNIVLKTSLKIDEPSTAEIEHFFRQCDVIAAMVFIKPEPTQEDIDTGQETQNYDGTEPPTLTEPVEELEPGEKEPKAIGDGHDTAVPVDSSDDSDELEPDADEQDDSPDTDDLPDMDKDDPFFSDKEARN